MNTSYLNIGEIPAKLFEADNARGTVLAVHGFGGSKESGAVALLAEAVCAAGLSVLAFDLPAHGERGGGAESLDPKHCISEIIQAERFIADKFGGEMYAFATSFGAMCLLHRLEQQPDSFRKIVLRVPAVNMAQSMMAICRLKNPDFSLEDAMRDGFSITLGRDYRIPYSFYEGLGKLACLRSSQHWNDSKILCIHAENDELVAPADTAEFLRCNPRIRSLCIGGASHRMGDAEHIRAAISAAAKHLSCV